MVRHVASPWFDSRIDFLPSDAPPERFVISLVRDSHLSAFALGFGLDNEQEACDILDKALVRGNHSEVHWISEDLCLPANQVWQGLCQIVAGNPSGLFKDLLQKIQMLLSN